MQVISWYLTAHATEKLHMHGTTFYVVRKNPRAARVTKCAPNRYPIRLNISTNMRNRLRNMYVRKYAASNYRITLQSKWFWQKCQELLLCTAVRVHFYKQCVRRNEFATSATNRLKSSKMQRRLWRPWRFSGSRCSCIATDVDKWPISNRFCQRSRVLFISRQTHAPQLCRFLGYEPRCVPIQLVIKNYQAFLLLSHTMNGILFGIQTLNGIFMQYNACKSRRMKQNEQLWHLFWRYWMIGDQFIELFIWCILFVEAFFSWCNSIRRNYWLDSNSFFERTIFFK